MSIAVSDIVVVLVDTHAHGGVELSAGDKYTVVGLSGPDGFPIEIRHPEYPFSICVKEEDVEVVGE